MCKLIYRKTKETDIKELTMIMKRAFDDDTKRHTDLLEDGPQGYDDGSLLKRLLALKDGATFTIYLDKKIIGNRLKKLRKDLGLQITNCY